MNSRLPSFFLLAASAAMLCGAGAIWAGKNRSDSAPTAPSRDASRDAQNSRRALSLLERSTQADNTLSYRATSRTVAFLGDKNLESSAKISRAPRHLCIETASGEEKGARSGYSERWFWRQSAEGKLVPYAQVRVPADEMALRRLALLKRNYRVSLGNSKLIDGRRAQAIELRPNHVIDGAQGPARRLWIDGQSGLTLAIESFNCALRPISFSCLSKVRIAPRFTPATFESPQAIFAALPTRNWQGEELGDDFRAAMRKTGFVPPRPTTLPPGFVLEGYGVHRCLTTGTLQPAAFSRYSDGLNCLTVFAFKPVNPNIRKTMRGICNFGPGALSSREDGGGRLVALGDLSAKTLARVLASARFETARKSE